MKTMDITPQQYCDLHILKSRTLQNITKHLRAGNPLPGVISVKKFSRFYLLVVPDDFTTKGYKEFVLTKRSKLSK